MTPPVPRNKWLTMTQEKWDQIQSRHDGRFADNADIHDLQSEAIALRQRLDDAIVLIEDSIYTVIMWQHNLGIQEAGTTLKLRGRLTGIRSGI